MKKLNQIKKKILKKKNKLKIKIIIFSGKTSSSYFL
jgi:hypothetical protein